MIAFLDNSGHYTLRGVKLLNGEKEETINLSREISEKREHIIEPYVRNIAWAKRAREAFGNYFMYGIYKNTFLKEDGIPYIEVHHIIPLCRGGEDGLWNLSVLCAHYHRRTHFAKIMTRV